MREAREAKENGGDEAARGSPAVRCVVLVPKDTAAPEKLIAGLRGRGAEVCVAADAPAVMVELAAGAAAVVLHEPERIIRVDELRDAIKKYHPKISHWQSGADAKGGVKLEAMKNGGKAGAMAREQAATPTKQAETPAQRSARPPTRVNGATGGRGKPASEDSPLVTPEEMEMLLGPVEDEGPQAGA